MASAEAARFYACLECGSEETTDDLRCRECGAEK